ncbi:trigger factor [Candidatus Methylopumilus planktonicus]|uniref:trigger factor n=1 Tax=Candidatus Methylopumilus planktonicus TaxID=1581557 RepID=UPI00111F66F9|nr:trigger factor [Candidatus Methylopumilus planktonicus]QDD01721.1 trigger factor [Candidatus Methylopumilus planktonicus]QDD07017.1 trigger factor [Candidatus Methylopumilus planktonicus]QDD08351.1 trigger factor [Candidatus Methylopumilus planktonicus]QDD09678.1 trigger factor [Candidatus Methylopumilus planktonicus]
MATAVETLSNLERRITVKVPVEPLQQEMSSRFQRLTRTAKVPGFRPGKAPLKMIEQQYGPQVKEEVFAEAIETSFGQAIEENKLRVVGMPNIQHKPLNQVKEDFEYTATFEVFPEVTLGDFKAISIDKPEAQITDKDVNKTIDVLLKQRAQFIESKEASAKGDRLTLTLTSFINDKQVETTGDKPIQIILGDDSRFAIFDDHLVGEKAGESKTFEVNYPETHNPKELAGKTVQYNVNFIVVAKPKLPEVNSQFAQSLGVLDGNVDQMRDEIKQSLEQELDKRVKIKLKEQVFTQLLEVCNADLPKALINLEINRMAQSTYANLKQRGADLKQFKLEPSMFEEQAKKTCKLRLVLAEIVDKNNLRASADQIRAMVNEFALNFDDTEEAVQWFYAEPSRLEEPTALATEVNVVEWFITQCKVQNKKTTFDELMTGPAPA